VTSLSFPEQIYKKLLARMDERPEQVGFMLASKAGSDIFRVHELRLVEGHRFASWSDEHAEADDAIRGEMIQWAWREDACLVEAHSHGRGFVPARFSRFDFSQFEEWVPHVRWRLRQRPYFALVTAGDEIDALAWLGANAEAIARISVDRHADVFPSGESIAYLEAQHDR